MLGFAPVLTFDIAYDTIFFGDDPAVQILLQKQPRKYLAAVDVPTRAKLYKALGQLSNLEGDITRLKGYDNLYRYKIAHYRILFSIDVEGNLIIVSTINNRTNIKY